MAGSQEERQASDPITARVRATKATSAAPAAKHALMLPPTAPKRQGHQTPHPPTKGKQALAKGGQKEEGQEMGQEKELKAPETKGEDKHTTTCAGSKPAHQTH